MEKRKMSSLMLRAVSALVMVPVVVGAILGGNPYVFFFALALAGMLSWEWSLMIPNKRPAFYSVNYMMLAAAGVLTYLSVNLAVFGIGVLALVYFKSRGEKYRKLLLLGVPYIVIGIGSLVWIFNSQGAHMLMWFVLVVWSVDVGGYLFGTTLKGPKLAPKISPNKTWSGLLGGVLLAVIVSSVYAGFYTSGEAMLCYGMLAAALAVIAQIGDLIESQIKRTLGIKDSSNLIPGHGGIFDRIDGLIFAAPFLYAFICISGWIFL